jgi:hypothetical protein
MDDGSAPNAVQITAVGSGYPSPPVLYFTRQYEYDFMTYELELIQKRYLGNGVYAAMDTLHYDRQNNAILASQALNYWSDVVPTGYTYTVRIRARDKHNRISGYSNAMDVSYYGSEAMVDDLIFDRGHSDNDRIALRWTDPPQHVPFSGYRLYRQKSGEPLWTLLGNVISGIQYYYDTAFTQSDTMLVSYRLVLQGNNNQTVSSNTCTGWLRAFAAPAISTVQFVGHDGIFLSWLPVTTTLSGHPDLPDYYQVEIADNLQFENAQTDWVIAEIQSYTHHPAPDNVLPERLFFRVYGLCSTQIRHGNRSDFD